MEMCLLNTSNTHRTIQIKCVYFQRNCRLQLQYVVCFFLFNLQFGQQIPRISYDLSFCLNV